MIVKKLASTLLLLTLAVAVQAQQIGLGEMSTPKATLDGSIQKRAGEDVEGVVVATIESGWHVNSNKPTEDFAIPTVLELEGATLVSAAYPNHVMRAFEFTGGKELAVYEGKFQIPFKAKLPAAATSFRAILKYQACSDRVCLAPNQAVAQIDATKTVAPVAPSASAFTPLSAAPKDAAKARGSLFSSDVGGTLASRGLPLTLLAIFVLGLALNLTPCVYPLIPITIGYFGQQSGSSTGRRVALSSLYVLGIAITYSALGVFSALSGKLFGAWLQHPAVLIFFALLMLVMSTSMFGLFEIQAPQWISNRSGGQAGLAGALTMGLVIGIVAAPCVGPFVISLIALVSSLQSPMLGFLMFFVLSLGLGLPYLFLGIFSSAASSIPRSGMWMIQVKRAMGFVLIAMAFYFLRPLIGDFAFQYGVAASLLVGAAFLLFTQGARVWRIALGVLLLVSGVAFAVPKEKGAEVQWDVYNGGALAAAKIAKKPVVIDFYADWCLPCKELDEKTFTDKAIVAEMDRFVRVKADLTVPGDAKTQELTKQYAIVGVPTIVFLDSSGNERKDLRVTGFEPAETFLGKLKQVQ